MSAMQRLYQLRRQTAAMLDVTGKAGVHLSDSLTKEDGPGAYRGVSRMNCERGNYRG
jgi:hypothetical protein